MVSHYTDENGKYVDVDVYINRSSTGIYVVMEWLTRHMLGVERHFKTKFETAREHVRQFAHQPLPADMKEAVGKNIEGIEMFLNDEKLGTGHDLAIPSFE